MVSVFENTNSTKIVSGILDQDAKIIFKKIEERAPKLKSIPQNFKRVSENSEMVMKLLKFVSK